MAVFNIDRLTRSMEGYIEILRILSKAGKGLIAVRQNLDLASPSGRFMLQLLVSAAEYFARLGAENTRAKMLSQASRGQYLAGRTPFGYDKGEGNVLIQNETEAPIIRDIFQRYAAGPTITEIRRVHNLPKNTMTKILHNPAYIGKISFSGQIFDGLHKPLIPPDVWATVQSNLPKGTSKPRPQAQKYDYLLSGLVRCSCGKAVSPCMGRGKGGEFAYYRCTDTIGCPERKYVRADALEDAVLKSVARAYKDSGTLRGYRQNLRGLNRTPEKRVRAGQKQNQAAIAKLAKKKRKITVMISEGLITRENAPAINAELTASLES